MKIVTAHQMKELDEKMIAQGISALSLMEKAGTGVANLILNLLDRNPSWPRKVVLFAGRGNNGGDAFVAARILEERGVKTQTVLLARSDEVKGDAKENLKKLKSRGAGLVEIKSGEDLARAFSDLGDYSVVVDGMVGTGAKGPLEGLLAEAADRINESGFLSTVSIDIPSGLDPDRGIVEGPCVRADHTVTMGLPKLGLVLQEGLEWVGALHVVDLGVPEKLLQEVQTREFLLTPMDLSLPSKRRRTSHKGTFGHLFILGGSPGLTGAPSLAALAALRSGAGLVTVGIGESLNSILETKLTEPMTLPLPEGKPGSIGLKALDSILSFLTRSTALVIGPGLGTHSETTDLVHQLIAQIKIPTVIDADGLNALAQNPNSLKKAKAPFILTPHPGEMARLAQQSRDQIQSHRWEVARTMAEELKAIVVLKGAGTAIAAGQGPVFVNVTGNPAMATGGMGDLLSGIIGGFLSQGMAPLEAAKLGVYLHGACGDEVVHSMGAEQGLLASDLLDFIPKKLQELRSLDPGEGQ